jgi:hypothetical protein
MTIPVTAMTAIDAVNIMLDTINEDAVNQLGSSLADAALAERILSETSKDVQSKGWHWNTETKYPLTPANNGEITVPSNILQLDLPARYATDVVVRGTRLYDRVNRTYDFTGKTFEAEIIEGLDFENMPEQARRYITIRAARVFQKRILGSDTIDKFTQEDEMKALVAMEQHEDQVSDRNIFNNYNIARAVIRIR